MPASSPNLRAFLDANPLVARVEVTDAKGSTPREAGTWMLVAPAAIFGTVGGGQLEFMAIDKAREMLAPESPPASAPSPEENKDRRSGAGPAAPLIRPFGAPTPRERGEGGAGALLDIPLGPEIGQCCGGRVGLAISVVDDGVRAVLMAETEAEDARLPAVYVFGGGHVGHALAQTLALLPVRATIVETRADAILDFPLDIETRLTAVPEEIVREAPAGSAFVVLTHDHALDFLIVAEALRRTDTAYVGMIGSATKKATFKSWYLKNAGGSEDAFARLVCPIGGDAVRDKRPAVIAALAAAEILAALATA
ncbi:xanthine dehydrogenase accessory protein XdhC [Aquibium oceanicum]|uniref:Xanthine dehydrogenase accessory protein XdhC n=1 Tax=Aquibium oceanicum TaxID=1670800 RepID=A0A1L3SX10_9HYPH|nr:xanthine dehydrogenase accessory protein XdhC [Aquibium oceanicum]APH73845.1 xanthine dehydrogenase accessory protein XdhC [Aquibium oceanicum]